LAEPKTTLLFGLDRTLQT